MRYKVVLAICLLVVVNSLVGQNNPIKLWLTDFPKSDLPSANFKKSDYGNRTSKDYYYGIGVSIDYKIARYLAFTEMAADTTSGTDVLMMLYANGYGVKRNFDIAIHLASANVWSAPAELDGRRSHLESMEKDGTDSVFDFCDDITSGAMIGECEEIQQEKKDYERSLLRAGIIKNWPAKDTAALNVLNKIAYGFFEFRSMNEVDLSGTMRGAFMAEAEDSMETEYLEEIKKADNCEFIGRSKKEFDEADSLLNVTYKKVMSVPDSKAQINWGTVTKETIRNTERKWIKYRDAWVQFSKVRCTSITEVSIMTFFTKQRINELKSFLP